MSQLVPCPRCKRHVRSTETACPFCESALPERAPTLTNPFRGRMSRAAILAAGATLMAAGAACEGDRPKTGDAGGDSTAMSDSAGGDGADAGDSGGAVDLNGSDVGNTTDSAANDRGIVALYGVVAPAPENGAAPTRQRSPDNG